MANIKNIIPFLLYFEAGLSKHYINLPFDEMFEKAKLTGWANDPDDSGGATMCGVTTATWKSVGYDKDGDGDIDMYDLKLITFDDWYSRVLKPHFWDRWKADQINCQAIANTLVDWVWASGANGIKIPQRILGVKIDGIVGPKTIAAINAADAKALFNQIQSARNNFIEDCIRKKPKNKKFRNGWLRRLNAITLDGFDYN